MLAPSQNISNFIKFSLLSFFLSGCGGGNVTRNNTTQPRSVTPTAFEIPASAINYHKTLDDLGLATVFTYGKVRVTPELITVPLTPRDINKDRENTGKITKETQLLLSLGNSIAQAISAKTNLAQSKIETIVYEVKCEARINDSRVVEDCDREFPFKYSPAKNESLHELWKIYNTNNLEQKKDAKVKSGNMVIGDYIRQRSEMYTTERQEKNEKNILDFCTTQLRSKFEKDFSPSFVDCTLVDLNENGESYFLIKDIKTNQFISNKYTEKFDIKIKKSTLHSSQALTLKISSPKYGYINQPNTYQHKMSTLETLGNQLNITKSEKIISTWFFTYTEKNNR